MQPENEQPKDTILYSTSCRVHGTLGFWGKEEAEQKGLLHLRISTNEKCEIEFTPVPQVPLGR